MNINMEDIHNIIVKSFSKKCETMKVQFEELIQLEKQFKLKLMNDIIDLVFEKGIYEWNSSNSLALMCAELNKIQIPTGDNTDTGEKQTVFNFRKLLIKRCQVEFEQFINDDARILKVEEINKCTDSEKTKDLEFELEEYDRRLRLKCIGITRFIGELFQQKMLTVNNILKIIKTLAEKKDEIGLECLCQLLKIVGKELGLKHVNLNDIFQQLESTIDKVDVYGIRIRRLVQNVIDLRKRNWSTKIMLSSATPISPYTTSIASAKNQYLEKLVKWKRVTNTLDEYIADKCSIDDFFLEIGEIDHSEMVECSYLHAMDKSQSVKLVIGGLFARLIKLGKIRQEDFYAGLKQLLIQANDCIVTNPKISDYLNELLADLICYEALPIESLLQPFHNRAVTDKYALKVLAPLFKTIIRNKSPEFLQNVWRKSGLQLEQFMAADEVNGFIKSNQFEFLSGTTLSFEQIHNKLSELLRKETSSDDIVNWITENVGDRTNDDEFIEVLTSAIFEKGKETSEEYNDLLLKYIKNYNTNKNKVDEETLDEEYQRTFCSNFNEP